MSRFATTLIAWHAHHGRHDLPWQRSREPYAVWLSEIMLQQTQVDTVIPYYLRFLARFPTLQSLAEAPLDEVLAHWSGLGYYARARNLHRTAQCVMHEYGGQFPQTAAALEELPGIGRSTAAAIAAFCFGERAAILDGNVKRVFARHFGIDGFPGERAVEQRMWALAEAELPASGIDTYTQALMDLGATLCTRSRPRCSACPLTGSCIAHRDARTHELPTPRAARRVPQRTAGVLILRAGGQILLERRPPQGIWGGLFSLPELLADESAEQASLRLLGKATSSSQALPSLRHSFTHFTLTLQPWLVDTEPSAEAAQTDRQWVALAALDAVGLPAPIRKLLAALE